MNIFCEQDESVTVVTIEGEFSIPESSGFHEFLLNRIENGSRDILIDFNLVPYVDSSAISILLSLLQVARNKGGDIRFARLNERTIGVFNQIGLNHVFRSFDSVDDGKKSFAQAEPT